MTTEGIDRLLPTRMLVAIMKRTYVVFCHFECQAEAT